MQDQITEAIDRLRGSATSHERWQVAQAVMADNGSEWLTVGMAPAERMTTLSILSSTPSALMRDYIREDLHHVDPWMQYCSRATRPIETNLEDRPETGPGGLDRRMTRLFTDHGLRHVVLVPGLSGQRTSALVLYAIGKDNAHALRRPDLRALTTVLATLITAFVRPDEVTEDHPQRYGLGPVLSPREREALLWLSTGLHTAEIAHRMGIESVTVSLHLASARRKLGARTREQALVIAFRDGLIAP